MKLKIWMVVIKTLYKPQLTTKPGVNMKPDIDKQFIFSMMLVVVCFIFIFTSMVLSAQISTLNGEIDVKEDEIYSLTVKEAKQKQDINALQSSVKHWMEKYYSYEPEVIYHNKTEYIKLTRNKYICNDICDVNRDGVIDYKDACRVLDYLSDDLSLMEQLTFSKHGNPYEKLYDVNIDGVVNIDDVDLIWEKSCD